MAQAVDKVADKTAVDILAVVDISAVVDKLVAVDRLAAVRIPAVVADRLVVVDMAAVLKVVPDQAVGRLYKEVVRHLRVVLQT